VLGRGAVPVPDAGRAPHGVTGADDYDVATADLSAAYALGDLQKLSIGVPVSGGAGHRREVDEARLPSRPGFRGDGAEINVTGGPVSRSLD
jgi:hypothetical protein